MTADEIPTSGLAALPPVDRLAEPPDQSFVNCSSQKLRQDRDHRSGFVYYFNEVETQLYTGGNSATRSFGYDLLGNRTLSVDRRGRATVYAYDARNQLYNEAWFGSLADANNNFNQLGGITYSYDLAGRMVQAGSYAFGYDILAGRGQGHLRANGQFAAYETRRTGNGISQGRFRYPRSEWRWIPLL